MKGYSCYEVLVNDGKLLDSSAVLLVIVSYHSLTLSGSCTLMENNVLIKQVYRATFGNIVLIMKAIFELACYKRCWFPINFYEYLVEIKPDMISEWNGENFFALFLGACTWMKLIYQYHCACSKYLQVLKHTTGQINPMKFHMHWQHI